MNLTQHLQWNVQWDKKAAKKKDKAKAYSPSVLHFFVFQWRGEMKRYIERIERDVVKSEGGLNFISILVKEEENGVNDFATLAKRASLRRWKNKAMEHKS
jgi:hypothetical protein